MLQPGTPPDTARRGTRSGVPMRHYYRWQSAHMARGLFTAPGCLQRQTVGTAGAAVVAYWRGSEHAPGSAGAE